MKKLLIVAIMLLTIGTTLFADSVVSVQNNDYYIMIASTAHTDKELVDILNKYIPENWDRILEVYKPEDGGEWDLNSIDEPPQPLMGFVAEVCLLNKWITKPSYMIAAEGEPGQVIVLKCGYHVNEDNILNSVLKGLKLAGNTRIN